MNTKSNSFDEVFEEIVDLLTEEDGDQKFIFLAYLKPIFKAA